MGLRAGEPRRDRLAVLRADRPLPRGRDRLRARLARGDGAAAPLSSLPELLRIYLVGNSLNYLAPGSVAGEPVRASMLRGRLETSSAIASVTIFKHAHLLSQAFFVATGLSVALVYFDLPAAARWSAGASLVVLFGLLVLMTWALQKGSFGPIVSGLARFRPLSKRLERFREPAYALDDVIRRFYAHRHVDFLFAAGWSLLGWCGGLLETYLVLRMLAPGRGWETAFAVESLAMLLNNLFLFVPGRAGTAEGVRTGVFVLLGMPASTGVAYGLVRRTRELLWVLPGLLFAREPVLARAGSGGRGRRGRGGEGAMSTRALLFDFGGTLDAEGVPWKERWLRFSARRASPSAATSSSPPSTAPATDSRGRSRSAPAPRARRGRFRGARDAAVGRARRLRRVGDRFADESAPTALRQRRAPVAPVPALLDRHRLELLRQPPGRPRRGRARAVDRRRPSTRSASGARNRTRGSSARPSRPSRPSRRRRSSSAIRRPGTWRARGRSASVTCGFVREAPVGSAPCCPDDVVIPRLAELERIAL